MSRKISINKNFRDIDVVILCGGFGLRLKKILNDRPKPMAEINCRPFLDILITYVLEYGFRRFILCIGYMADVIKNYFKNKKFKGEIIFSKEDKPLGTAGAIKNAEKHIRSSTFLVMNGDSFCRLNLVDFFEFHKSKSASLSIAVTKAKSSKEFGLITLDKFNRIVGFQEKKQQQKAFINAGIYIFEKKILSLIPSNRDYSLECEFFPGLVGKEFYGYETKEELIDIGTPRRYKYAKKFFYK